jgi:hypothetical protein
MKQFLISAFMIICSCSIGSIHATAQTNHKVQKAEKALLNYLHAVCKKYTTNEMGIDLGSIHQAYTIHNGSLSVVRKHQDETDAANSFFVKTSIAISEIEDVFYDYYIGFVGRSKQSVKEEKSNQPAQGYTSSGYLHLMHIAPVGDGEHGYDVQKKLLELVRNLKQLYATSD